MTSPAEQDAASRTATDTMIRIERTLSAAPHVVYRAWLDPNLVWRWMASGGDRVTRVEIDARPGGAYRTWKANDSGRIVGGFDSELLELEEDTRLRFRWGFIGPKRREGPSYDTSLTITMRPVPDEDSEATLLTLVHEQLDELAAAMPHIARAVPSGWDAFLDHLDDLVGHGAFDK
jgi:uncharacterized protein YndB with AHSA1/START domain